MNIAGFIANGTPEILILAVINTRAKFEDERPLGLKAGSDTWLYHSQYRPHLVAEVKREWSAMAGAPPHECPFIDDIILDQWVACRKGEYTAARLHEDLKRLRRDVESLFVGV